MALTPEEIKEEPSKLLNDQATKLAEATGFDTQRILDELVIETERGFTDEQAVVNWKADNQMALGKGTLTYSVRVLAKGGK